MQVGNVEPYINTNAPFGPVASELIDDRTLWNELFDRENRAYSHLRRRDPAFVVGRRGSGKTMFLFALTTDEPTLNVTINTSTAVAEIEDLLRSLDSMQITLFADHISELWASALWHGIFAALVRNADGVFDEQDRRFETIKIYLDDLSSDNARTTSSEAIIGLFCGELLGQVETKRMVARHPTLYALNGVTMNDLIGQASELLVEAAMTPVLLMDSIEDFQDVLDYHTRAIEGLFMQVGRSAQPSAPFRIRFSFPAELWHELRKMSRNPLKDFGRFVVLQWSAREIVKIAAHRFMIYLEHFQPDYLAANRDVAKLNTDNEPDALALLRTVLPVTLRGELGVEEDSIAYVLRHTQLLPRHLLRLLNAIWSRGDGFAQEGVVRVGDDAVIKGICDIEEQIVTEICKAYELVYPAADDVCRAVIKNLPRRFSDSELHKSFNRVGKGALKRSHRRIDERRFATNASRVGSLDQSTPDMDYFEFRSMLLEIGCIGRQVDETERYYVAEFEYAIPQRLAVGDDDMMCVHPLFSGVYQSKEPDGDEPRRLVYPYGSDPSTDHRLQQGD
ncbi:MAG: P-loop ATPase, Sll1717 family [Acidimicrobiales bacterium]